MKLVRLTLHDGTRIVFGPGGLIIGPAPSNPAGMQTAVYWGGERRLVRESPEAVAAMFEELQSD